MVTLSVQTQQTAPDKEADFANLLDSQTRALEVCTDFKPEVQNMRLNMFAVSPVTVYHIHCCQVLPASTCSLALPGHNLCLVFQKHITDTCQPNPGICPQTRPPPRPLSPKSQPNLFPDGLYCAPHPEDPALVALPVHSPCTYLAIYPFTSKMWEWSLKTDAFAFHKHLFFQTSFRKLPAWPYWRGLPRDYSPPDGRRSHEEVFPRMKIMRRRFFSPAHQWPWGSQEKGSKRHKVLHSETVFHLKAGSVEEGGD